MNASKSLKPLDELNVTFDAVEQLTPLASAAARGWGLPEGVTVTFSDEAVEGASSGRKGPLRLGIVPQVEVQVAESPDEADA